MCAKWLVLALSVRGERVGLFCVLALLALAKRWLNVVLAQGEGVSMPRSAPLLDCGPPQGALKGDRDIDAQVQVLVPSGSPSKQAALAGATSDTHAYAYASSDAAQCSVKLCPASQASRLNAPDFSGGSTVLGREKARAKTLSSSVEFEKEYCVSPSLYWWMKPAYTCAGIGAIIVAVSWTLLTAPETLPIAFLPSYSVGHLTSVLLLFGCLFGGICFGSLRDPFARPHLVFTAADLARVRGLAAGMTAIVGVAYLLWLGFALSRGVTPILILEVFTLSPGAIQTFKAMATPVGGITTLVQLAPPAACLWVLLLKCGQRNALRPFVLLLVCTGLRAFMYAERLSVLEVVVPVLFCALGLVVTPRESTRQLNACSTTADLPAHSEGAAADAKAESSDVHMSCDNVAFASCSDNDNDGKAQIGCQKPSRRGLFSLLPVFGAMAGWLLFTASEYTRSWQFYKYFYEDGFIAFVNARLITYYATAFNNGAVYAAAVEGRPHVAYMSCPALWDAPFIGGLLGRTGNDGYDWADWWEGILALYASAEFNSTGSFLVLEADLGIVLAAAIFLAVGLIIGWMYSLASQGSVAGLMALGSLNIGLYESLRFFYWGQGRFAPVLIGCILAFVTLSTLPSRTAARLRCRRETASPQTTADTAVSTGSIEPAESHRWSPPSGREVNQPDPLLPDQDPRVQARTAPGPGAYATLPTCHDRSTLTAAPQPAVTAR